MHKRARKKANRYFFYEEVAKNMIINPINRIINIKGLVLGLRSTDPFMRNNAKLTLKFIRKLDKELYNEVINELSLSTKKI